MKKRIELSLLFGLVFCIVLSFANFDAKCDEIKDEILRLHIIANSDSKEDQALKLKVRDAILNETQSELACCDNINDAINVAGKDIEKIISISNITVKENGYDYNCVAEIGKENFKTRVYDDFTLPAGEYNSLIVRIGEAKGHNWWCVIFPSVCIPTSTEKSLDSVLSEESNDVCINSEKYILRFKTAEIYEKVKENMKNFKK